MIILLKNYNFKDIVNGLQGPMKFQDGRIRNKFLDLFAVEFFRCEQERRRILEDVLLRNQPEGTVLESLPTYVDPMTGHSRYKMTDEQSKEVSDRWDNGYQMQESEVTISEDLEKLIPRIKQIINNIPKMLDERETESMEMLLNAFDKPVIKRGPEDEAEKPAEESDL